MIETINGNALSIPLQDNTVQCVITSPPYWGLRDYGVVNQIGLESTPQAYVSNIVAVMRECWRVMRDDATLWLVIGDTYSSAWASGRRNIIGNGSRDNRIDRRSATGLKEKDLIGIPWRVAFALQDDGWYLRSDIIWHKPNPMPESVTDRPTKAHEYVFLLAKQERYYYDAEAIKEPQTQSSIERAAYGWSGGTDDNSNGARSGSTFKRMAMTGELIGTIPEDGMRNKRSVWTVATQPYSGAHFATFPPALIEPMILAGSRPGDIILDPFAGTSTVGRVCAKYVRKFIGVELNPAYIELAQDRTSKVQIAFFTGAGGF